MKSKRILVISDTHCGHLVGLTPPDFNPQFGKKTPQQQHHEEREIYWKWFAKEVDALRPFDALIFNGDAIDGKGDKSGGTEQLTTDRNQQCDMAIQVIEHIKAKDVFMSFGTAYHSGASEDFEEQIANAVAARKIGAHDWLNVNGLVIDYKHHVGGSQSPVGRATPLSREHLWSILWAEHGEYSRAKILIRSHTHAHVYTGGYGWLAMVTPALQGYGSKFGARRISGTVDFGFVHFDIEDKENWSWQAHILKQKSHQVPARL